MKIITKTLIIIFVAGLLMTVIAVYNGLSYSAINEFLDADDTFGEKIFYTEESVINSIVLDIEDRSVFIAQGTGDQVLFNYHAHEKDTWTITENDGVLTIKQVKSRNILDWIDYKEITKALKNTYITLPATRDMTLDLSNRVGDISIYENDNYFEFIKVNMYVGNFGLRGVNVDDVDIKLRTGNMLFTNVIVDGDLDISNQTGQVRLDGGDYQDVNIKNSTGTIVLTNLNALQLTLSTATGNISTNNVNVANQMEASSGTGKVIVNNTTASGYDLSTKTGEVVLVLPVLNSIKYDLATSTGRISLNGTTLGSPYLTQTGTVTLKVRVSTGDIRITIQ